MRLTEEEIESFYANKPELFGMSLNGENDSPDDEIEGIDDEEDDTEDDDSEDEGDQPDDNPSSDGEKE